MINYFKLFFLTILNCIVEFLPISSTAHNLILLKFLSVNSLNVDLFLSFLQLPITAVMCIYFFRDIKAIILTFFKDKNTRIFCYKIILTFMPTVLFGLLFNNIIKTYFYNNILSISIFLIIGGLFMIRVNENKTIKYKNIYDIDFITSVKIGLCQMFSLLPGISRSATTIYTSLMCGVEKSTAIDYSFFISIPLSFLASCYNIYKNLHFIQNNSILEYCIFLLIAFVFSLIFIKRIFIFLKTMDFKKFGYYRITIGLLIIILGYTLCRS